MTTTSSPALEAPRLVHVEMARVGSFSALRHMASKPRRPTKRGRWVQLALPGVPIESTRKRRRLHSPPRRPALILPWQAQIEIDFPLGVRLSRRDRLERIGRDPCPDAPWEKAPERVRRFAELFPDGMAFSEIGRVLGMRKQAVFKIYVKAITKLGATLDADEEAIRDALLERDESRSTWDTMMGT